MSNLRIVCAAVRTPAGLIVCGPRHFDATMWCQILGVTPGAFRIMQQDGTLGPLPEAAQHWRGAEEGFIDQLGNFYTREEAWPLALGNNQIDPHESNWQTGRLHSEHLY